MAMSLENENRMLRERVKQLENEIAFLRTHPVFLQGLKGESIVSKLTGGAFTEFAASHDLKIGSTVKVEVKFSKLNTPNKGRDTRRWNWSKLLGWKDKGKDYDFLVLVGEKDWRYPEQYLDQSPYVFFLIPKAQISEIITRGKAIGSQAQITTRLAAATSPASMALKKYLVPAAMLSELIDTTKGAQTGSSSFGGPDA
ncbi:hypothetical protein [Aeromonas sp. FDAARGOS 1415]|uniref:hypothetical protein n=1 Tax=Aeromonas TaxID=642 RepID=UPI001C21B535|nr:hypothetical protein [Aeromonas sp. FDAARGOS 1415]QXB53466.1 hypothetical protein I6L45_12705 [Aeromonas sp. FDAARGOS 1415]